MDASNAWAWERHSSIVLTILADMLTALTWALERDSATSFLRDMLEKDAACVIGMSSMMNMANVASRELEKAVACKVGTVGVVSTVLGSYMQWCSK